MRHIIVVEGITDKGIIQGIAEKLRVRPKPKILLMSGNRPEKVVRCINSELTSGKYSKVIILKDQHRYPESSVTRYLMR